MIFSALVKAAYLYHLSLRVEIPRDATRTKIRFEERVLQSLIYLSRSVGNSM